jgi:hypothetical protein
LGGALTKSGEITTDKYANILAYFSDLNSEWLLTGKGEMLKSEPEPEASTVYNNVEEKKPPPAVPESEPVAAIYSMLIGRNESLARENGEMKAKIEQLKTEVEQLKAEIEQLKLKAESEELKKYEHHPYDTAYNLSPPPMIAAEPEIEYISALFHLLIRCLFHAKFFRITESQAKFF